MSDLDEVVSAVLDAPALTMYLHPELDGRVPVEVGGPALAGATIDAIAQGQPVEVCGEVGATDRACVFFERVQIVGATAEVELRYPIEGVIGRFRLQRDGASWRIAEANVAER